MALELLNDVQFGKDVSELSKADIFSLGISMFELIKNTALPMRDEAWHQLRNNETLDFGTNKG